ncbi:hypothetical protein [Streptomyces sp. NPDC048637]|uniref:hypothetical protein n=1 Tax=Streptomyces sp. NPDC048637 TaxID=3155636 RepID=UPI00342AFEEB
MSLPSGIEPVYVIAAVGVLALVLAGWSIRRNRTRAGAPRAGTPAVWVAALAALNCTLYSADTSWRFAAVVLDMAGTVERAMMFSAAELALFATALMARQNLKAQGAPGLPGGLVWVITGVQVIPAYAMSGAVGGTVRAFVGPVMAAVLWHLAMGIELRLRTPDAASQGLLSTLGREVRERLLSRLGVAGRNRDAAQIAKDRATRRAVALAARLAGMTAEEREKDTRITRRLQSALTRSGVGTNPQQRRALLEQLASRRHAAALATVDLPSPWIQPEPDQDADRENRSPLAWSRQLNAVPNDAPQGNTWIGDRPDSGTGTGTAGDRPDSGTGTGTGTAGDRPHTVPNDNGDRVQESSSMRLSKGEGSMVGDQNGAAAEAGDADDRAGGSAPGSRETAAQGSTAPSPATVPNDEVGREHPDAEAGTEADGDRPGTVPNDNEDPEHARTETGTEPVGDRPHTVPLRRKQKAKAQRSRPGAGKTKRSQRRPQLSIEETVKLVRPHVPALLERDGNASLTRPQLREILRTLNLGGGRNESLTPVLHRLRTEANVTTRSTR